MLPTVAVLMVLFVQQSSTEHGMVAAAASDYINAGNVGYSETVARFLVQMAGVAYSDEPLRCMRSNGDPNIAGLQLVYTLKRRCLGRSDPCGFVIAESARLRVIVVAFQGTKNHRQLIHELWNGLTMPMRRFPRPGRGFVQDYFRAVFLRLWPLAARRVLFAVRRRPAHLLFFTGHSLGAALATMAAVRVAGTQRDLRPRIGLYTFGEPRVGDAAFAGYVDATLMDAWRVVHRYDPVAHLPTCAKHWFEIWLRQCLRQPQRPYHHATEVFYPSGEYLPQDEPPHHVVTFRHRNRQYIVCPGDEDVKCSDSINHWVRCTLDSTKCLHDHLYYFGLHVGLYCEKSKSNTLKFQT